MLNPAQVGGIVGGGCAVLVGTTSLVVALARRRTVNRFGDDPTARPAGTSDLAEATPTARDAGSDSMPRKVRAEGRGTDQSSAGTIQTVEHVAGDHTATAKDPVEAWLVPDPWAKRAEDSSNGGRPGSDVTPTHHGDASGVARAERSAVELLREAGFGVEPSPTHPQHAPVEATRSQPELQDILREFLSQRVITVAILEEATRRMRAENARLEQALNSEPDER